MKRYTETDKWGDPWFRSLPPAYKLLFMMMCDRCDLAGFYEPDFELASFQIGATVTAEKAKELLGGRVRVVEDGKWFLVKFLKFQFPVINPANKFHMAVIKCLESHGMEVPKPSASAKKPCPPKVNGAERDPLDVAAPAPSPSAANPAAPKRPLTKAEIEEDRRCSEYARMCREQELRNYAKVQEIKAIEKLERDYPGIESYQGETLATVQARVPDWLKRDKERKDAEAEQQSKADLNSVVNEMSGTKPSA